MSELYCGGKVYTAEHLTRAAQSIACTPELQSSINGLAEDNFRDYKSPYWGHEPATPNWIQEAKAMELTTKLGAWCGLCDEVYLEYGAEQAEDIDEIPLRYNSSIIFAGQVWSSLGLLATCDNIGDFTMFVYQEEILSKLWMGGFADGYVTYQSLRGI